MHSLRVAVDDIPAQGRQIIVDTQSVWTKPMQDLHINCDIVVPLHVKVLTIPVQGGVLVRGKLKGQVTLACDLCAEDASVSIDYDIDTFEAIPGESIPFEDEEDEESMDFEDTLASSESRIILEKNVPYLDLAALCWEEFMLALPMRPLCQENCQGLCPHCGKNLNEENCSCSKDEGDPRLALLRTIKITPK